MLWQGLCVRLCIAAENVAKLSGGKSPITAVVLFERAYCRELLVFRRYRDGRKTSMNIQGILDRR
jgi:hypothetical protein